MQLLINAAATGAAQLIGATLGYVTVRVLYLDADAWASELAVPDGESLDEQVAPATGSTLAGVGRFHPEPTCPRCLRPPSPSC